MPNSPDPLVGVIMGSKSDWEPATSHASQRLHELGVPHENRVISAHRTPRRVPEYADNTKAKVIIACAGGAAHLPGMTAAETIKPVIGIPAHTSGFHGVDSLLSIAQMPTGVPVGTTAVGEEGAIQAANFAQQILRIAEKQSFTPEDVQVFIPDECAAIMQSTIAMLQRLNIDYTTHNAADTGLNQLTQDTSDGIIIAGVGHNRDIFTNLDESNTPIIAVPGLTPEDEDNGIAMLKAITGASVPAVTMATGKKGAENAALFTASILALADPSLAQLLKEYRESLVSMVDEMDSFFNIRKPGVIKKFWNVVKHKLHQLIKMFCRKNKG